MRDEADRSGRGAPDRGDALRPRPRPGPAPAQPPLEPRSRRRLGRFFAVDELEAERPVAPVPADAFPGVPRPDRLAPEPAAAPPRPRPRPVAAQRPRPGRQQ